MPHHPIYLSPTVQLLHVCSTLWVEREIGTATHRKLRCMHAWIYLLHKHLLFCYFLHTIMTSCASRFAQETAPLSTLDHAQSPSPSLVRLLLGGGSLLTLSGRRATHRDGGRGLGGSSSRSSRRRRAVALELRGVRPCGEVGAQRVLPPGCLGSGHSFPESAFEPVVSESCCYSDCSPAPRTHTLEDTKRERGEGESRPARVWEGGRPGSQARPGLSIGEIGEIGDIVDIGASEWPRTGSGR
jgi:hypothetical protein